MQVDQQKGQTKNLARIVDLLGGNIAERMQRSRKPMLLSSPKLRIADVDLSLGTF